MTKKSANPSLFNLGTPAGPQGPVECLGMTIENDEAWREHFLGLLREGLEELHARLGGVPFTAPSRSIPTISTPSSASRRLRSARCPKPLCRSVSR